MEKEKEEFNLGLVLAGGVSCGTFIAGALDMLMRSLDDAQNPKLKLSCIGAASAGSLTALALCRQFYHWKEYIAVGGNPIPENPDPNADLDYGRLLADVWVNKSDERILFSTRNLHGQKSILNPTKMEEYVEKITCNKGEPISKETADALEKFIDPQGITLFMTAHSLNGTAYEIRMAGHNNNPYNYYMHLHKHYQTFDFKLDGTGTWQNAGTTALASSAFPLAFPSRKIIRQDSTGKYMPSFCDEDPPKPVDARQEYWAIDGGTSSGEPLSLVLNDLKKKEKPFVIILIDPFHNKMRVGPSTDGHSLSLKETFSSLISSMREQTQFMPHVLEYQQALEGQQLPKDQQGDKDHLMGKQFFQIGPSRDRLAGEKLKRFGGFLVREWREHDYLMGRYKAYNFLSFFAKDKDTFHLPQPYAIPDTDKKPKPVSNEISDDTIQRIGRYIRKVVPQLLKPFQLPSFIKNFVAPLLVKRLVMPHLKKQSKGNGLMWLLIVVIILLVGFFGLRSCADSRYPSRAACQNGQSNVTVYCDTD